MAHTENSALMSHGSYSVAGILCVVSLCGRYVDQDIYQPKQIIQPVLQQRLVEQPIIRTRLVKQPIRRTVINKSFIRPHLMSDQLQQQPTANTAHFTPTRTQQLTHHCQPPLTPPSSPLTCRCVCRTQTHIVPELHQQDVIQPKIIEQKTTRETFNQDYQTEAPVTQKATVTGKAAQEMYGAALPTYQGY